MVKPEPNSPNAPQDLDLASTVWQLSCSLLGLPDDEDRRFRT